MSSLSPDAFIVNKYTKRPLKRGGRAYINYMKKLKRENEDEELLTRTAINRKKQQLLKSNGFDEDEGDEADIEIHTTKTKVKNKTSTKDAMNMLKETLNDLDDDSNYDEILTAMFEKML
jgi:hypothetical protein